MLEYYLEIRLVHMTAVIASGALFFLRGFSLHALDAHWPMAAPIRYLSYTIDTILLTAALMLMTIVQQYPFVDAWLTVKVVLLVVYIILGVFGLRLGKTKTIRVYCWLSALLVYGFIVTVARAHHPLGIFSGIMPW